MKHLTCPSLKAFYPPGQDSLQKFADSNGTFRLRNIKHTKHDHSKYHEPQYRMCQLFIQHILRIPDLSRSLFIFNLFDNTLYKFKTFPVCFLHFIFVMQINSTLSIYSFLSFTGNLYSRLNDILETFVRCGYCLDYRTSQRLRKQYLIYGISLLLAPVAFIQCNHNRYSQFKQLCRKEQAAAQAGCIHDINNDIGMLLFHISAGNTFL